MFATEPCVDTAERHAPPPVHYARDEPASTGALIDAEARRIIDECFAQARSMLNEHRPQLDDLVRALLEEDTLDRQRILEVTGLTPAATAPATA